MKVEKVDFCSRKCCFESILKYKQESRPVKLQPKCNFGNKKDFCVPEIPVLILVLFTVVLTVLIGLADKYF